MRSHTETRTLRSFCRTVEDVALADIKADRVYAYIAGTGPVTRFWHCKHEALRGFYRFAIGRGYTLAAYAARRSTDYPADPEAPFFVSRKGTALTRRTAENTFRRLCARAGVKRDDGSRFQPRLHDLRHRADFPIMPTFGRSCGLGPVWRRVATATRHLKSA